MKNHCFVPFLEDHEQDRCDLCGQLADAPIHYGDDGRIILPPVPPASILAEANAGLGQTADEMNYEPMSIEDAMAHGWRVCQMAGGGRRAVRPEGRVFEETPPLTVESTTAPFAVTVTQPSTGHPSGDELLMTNAMTALAKSFGWEIKHELQPCGRVLITRFTPGRGE